MESALSELSPSRRRSKLEIYIDVLRIIKRGVNKPTRVMYAANISWKPLIEILANLERQGLVERKTVRNSTLVFITEKGKRVLRTLETLSAEFSASRGSGVHV
ncbi:MAG: winged helix-turn-helix domain-containing protein [Candidatus Bathyarchaeia archaeon]